MFRSKPFLDFSVCIDISQWSWCSWGTDLCSHTILFLYHFCSKEKMTLHSMNLNVLYFRIDVIIIVFNWNHFEMSLNLRINQWVLIWELILIYCGLFVLILVVVFFCVCVLFLLSLRFGQISPLAFFRWFTATSDRNAESCNRIPSNYCPP